MKKQAADKLKVALGAVTLFFVGNSLGINPSFSLFLLVLAFYLKAACPEIRLRPFNLLNLTLLFLIILTIGAFFTRSRELILWIPYALIPMLATLLFADLAISLLLSTVSSLALIVISGSNVYLGLLALISGICSSLLVLNARKRITLIRAGLVTGVIQALSLFFISDLRLGPPVKYLILLVNGLVSSIIVAGSLPVFEYLFRTVTNISLLELADFHHPLLQRMIMEAPGTYHHSLIVGNLSEAACQKIGAHALLARIGAYYHDIGKLPKPEYFSENQSLQTNKHDSLSPTMSKMVIMNHVKEGVELARKHRLNPRLIDFIQQHHGSSLVYYFYRRALEGLEEDQGIKEEGFRYPGPKPRTRETAVVLLADSAEAATRALKEPSPVNIAEVVHKIINNKFIDGQLDECDLTLKDIEAVSNVFVRILGGMYHSRINYPQNSPDANTDKKPAKETSHHSQRDKKDSP